MPYFSAGPTSNLVDSLRRAIGGGGGELDPMTSIKIDQAAADTAHKMSLVGKLKAESEAIRQAQAARADPALQTEFAGRGAGLDLPTAALLEKHVSGVRERPLIEGDDEGNRMPDVTYAQPAAVTPGQRQMYDALRTASIASRLGGGPTNAEQLLHAATRGQENRVLATAADAAARGDVSGVNLNAAGVLGKKELTPFKTDTHGITTNEYTGKRDESGGLAAVLRAASDAQRVERLAHAGLYGAQASKTSADKEREAKGTYDPVRGILVDPRAGTAREVLGVDGKPIGAKPKSDFKDVTTLRKEFNDQAEVKAYRDVLPIVESARGAPDTRSGDIQMAYAVGKILDPNSVVREGELKLVGDAATMPERLQGQIRTLVMGKGRMTPETRAQLVAMLDSAVTNRETTYKATEATYRAIAQQNGFPLDQVIIDPPKRATPPGLPKNTATTTNSRGWRLMTDAAGNKAYVSPDGKQFEEAK